MVSSVRRARLMELNLVMSARLLRSRARGKHETVNILWLLHVVSYLIAHDGFLPSTIRLIASFARQCITPHQWLRERRWSQQAMSASDTCRLGLRCVGDGNGDTIRYKHSFPRTRLMVYSTVLLGAAVCCKFDSVEPRNTSQPHVRTAYRSMPIS